MSNEMTLTEISVAYGIPQPDISKAITENHIRARGSKFVLSCNRTLRAYDEQEVVTAVSRLWRHRANSFAMRANLWHDKTDRLTQEMEKRCLSFTEIQEQRKTVSG